ncbi:hypothetical protein [Pseudoflavonifractor capillosus]|uniref:Uncharacterized protein n=1 Tax=Pseudoflavonifractor capillosus TaxID=106588 RepID=A0A921MKB1_9FIRM|nr:hypothetical protein [Pseudoflavonifractor capillosus]HJG85757.1 hypothetical protein [Pseudoflavonifractor capillosus]
MDDNRRLELIEAEYLRHMAMALADPDRRDEHEEVAGALAWALDSLRKGDEKT